MKIYKLIKAVAFILHATENKATFLETLGRPFKLTSMSSGLHAWRSKHHCMWQSQYTTYTMILVLNFISIVKILYSPTLTISFILQLQKKGVLIPPPIHPTSFLSFLVRQGACFYLFDQTLFKLAYLHSWLALLALPPVQW